MVSAVTPLKTEAIRLFHLTFYKCGSQWVRDVLADPRIVEISGHPIAAGGVDLQSERWPNLEVSQFASPLYSTGTGEWQRIATESDRAFVVIRDPRDIVVSLVFSVSLSHTPSAITLLLRTPIADSTPANRLQIGMFLLAQWADYLRTWKDAGDYTNVHLARYEDLIVDLSGELRRLFEFLNWNIPDSIIDAVATENAFQSRSGRKPGDENEFSHRRKGIAGDWRNHFDRERGQLFENAFPGLLTDLGYEPNDEWWRDLPVAITPESTREESQRARLLAVLEEHEKELAAVRIAAEERLRDVGILHDALEKADATAQDYLTHIGSLTEQISMLRGELEEARKRVGFLEERCLAIPEMAQTDRARLNLIGSLTTQLNATNHQLTLMSRAAEERLAALKAAEASRIQLENSFSWRFGYRSVRAIGSLFAKKPSAI